MASESDASWTSTIFSWPGMMFIAALLGVVVSTTSLDSKRPAPPLELSGNSSSENGGYYCRAVEDPWVALARETKLRESEKGNTAPAPISLSAFHLPVEKPENICVLPIIVYGDLRTAEATESRTRTRVAVAAGLGACGYIADNNSRLTLLDLGPAAGGETESRGFEKVPAEWYISSELPRASKRGYSLVLVLWIQDRMVFDTPLEKLEGLRNRIFAEIGNLLKKDDPEKNGESHFQFKVIGPWWSGILTDMLKETDKHLANEAASASAKPTKLAPDVKFYSATATMADPILDIFSGRAIGNPHAGEQTQDEPSSARDFIRSQVSKFYNLSCTDDQIALNLLRELSLRGVDPIQDDTRIAIISDWGSEYGRALPLTFAAVLKQQLSLRDFEAFHELNIVEPKGKLDDDFIRKMYTDDPAAWPRQIIRAHYFNGIDGEVTSTTDDKPKTDSVNDSAPVSNKGTSVERAEGTQQVDALRRFASSLGQRIREYDAPGHKPGQLRAIGIMGPDVYDKILLLRALRPMFPGVLFFTIGLDARFMHPDELPYTRNLIVGSPYGLELFRTFQLGAPPFRDTNETAVFLAVQAAMEQDEKFSNIVYSPQLYEVSRSGAVPLVEPWAQQESDSKDDLVGLANKWQGPLHPAPFARGTRLLTDWQRASTKMVQSLIGATCIMAVLALVFLGHIVPRRGNKRYLLVTGFSLLTVAIVGLFLMLYDGVEPLSFLNGASLWPSELIRLIAFMLGIGFLLFIHASLKNHSRELQDEFSLTSSCSETNRPLSHYLNEIGEIFARKDQETKDYIMSREEAQQNSDGLSVSDSNKKIASVGATEKDISLSAKPTHTPRRKDRVHADAVWIFFCRDSQPFKRYGRAALMMVLYIMGCLSLLAVVGRPEAPFRGNFSWVWDSAMMWLSGLTLIYLIFIVVSVTDSTKQFIERLSTSKPTFWGKLSEQAEAQMPEWPEYEEAMGYYFDVKFIGRITNVTLRFIYFPFIVLTLLIFARWTYFAHWQWTPFIIILYFADVAICVYCAILLRKQAVRAKDEAVVAMNQYIALAQISYPAAAAPLEIYRKEIEDNQDGAFTPWSRQPVVSALLIPLGGGGLIQLIQQFGNL